MITGEVEDKKKRLELIDRLSLPKPNKALPP